MPMKNFLRVAVLLCAAATMAIAADDKPRPRQGDLKVGDAARGFTVQDMTGKTTVKLASLKGKPVVLIFGSCT